MLEVLRINHRSARDKRITTHCGLVARAFGADSFILSGDEDESVLDSLRKVSTEWGGTFAVEYIKSWRSYLKRRKKEGFVIVHLTMYGYPLQSKIGEIRVNDKIVVIIGASKVPADVYKLADYNVAVGNQPHSEVAALALFLDRFFEGAWEDKQFENAKLHIVPSNYKHVEET